MRKISNEELADLPNDWENPTVDTRFYIEGCMNVWEITKEQYEIVKAEGFKCQKYKEKYYAGV